MGYFVYRGMCWKTTRFIILRFISPEGSSWAFVTGISTFFLDILINLSTVNKIAGPSIKKWKVGACTRWPLPWINMSAYSIIYSRWVHQKNLNIARRENCEANTYMMVMITQRMTPVEPVQWKWMHAVL